MHNKKQMGDFRAQEISKAEVRNSWFQLPIKCALDGEHDSVPYACLGKKKY